MTEIHLRQSRFHCVACRPFNKSNLKKNGRKIFLAKKLDKVYYQPDMVFGGFIYLPRRT